MKELTIEQKAQRYDEAIEVAREYWNSPRTCIDINVLPKLFPELKESEDERIKDCIGICLTDADEQRFKDFNTTLKDCLDWLHNQGENAYNEELSKLLHKVICHFINNPDIPYSKRDEVSKKVIPYVEKLEKQNEQNLNPCDGCINRKGCINCENGELREVEYNLTPKVLFKKGDWVVSNRYTSKPSCITKICDTYYLVDNDSFILFGKESDWRHWTIQDAKAGDVLIDNYNNIVLYQEPYSNLLYHSFCFASTKVFVDSGGSHFIEGTYPATKEQRDLLFQKMKEAGYEWDAEKKELRRIKQNPTENEELTEFDNTVVREQKK